MRSTKTAARLLGLNLPPSNVIAVCVTQENDVQIAEARIVRAGHGLPGVIQYAHAARVFKDRRAIRIAELTWMRPDRRDLDVLCDGWKGCQCGGDSESGACVCYFHSSSRKF
jgi:hypothetical protein